MLKLLNVFLISIFFLSACNNTDEIEHYNSGEIKTVIQTGHRFIIQEIYFANRDRMFLSGSNNIYKLWDIESKLLIGTWDKQPDNITILGFDKNDEIIAYDNKKYEYTLSPIDGSIKAKSPLTQERIDQTSNEIVREHEISEDTENNIWTSPTGRYQVISPKYPGGSWVRNTDSRITLKDLKNKSEIILHEEAQWIWDMAISGDGRYLVCIEERVEGQREVCFYDLFKAALIKRITWLPDELQDPPDTADEDAEYQDCMINYDGSRVIAYTRYGATYVWDTKNWKLIYHFLPGAKLTADYPSMDMTGTLLAMRNSSNNKNIVIIDIKTGKTIRQFPLPEREDDRKTIFSPDGKYLASVSNNRVRRIFDEYIKPPIDTAYERTIVIWNYITGEVIQIIKDNGEYIGPFGFNYDSRYILCGLDVYQVKDGRLLQSIPEIGFKGLRDITDKFGLFWLHHSEFAMNPNSNHFNFLDEKTENIVIRNSKNFNPICELYCFADAVLIVTPDGYFSGTGEYKNKIHFVIGTTAYQFRRFYRKYYQPDLIYSRLAIKQVY